jgi:Ni/Co efflux regulator RcnB
MKQHLTRILPAAVAATIALTGVAAAQPHGHAYGHDKWHKEQRKADRKWEKQQRKAERRAERAWRRGEYLPPEYRSSHYRLYDYHQYGLQAPPRGYEYYRQGNDVLLTAISSG